MNPEAEEIHTLDPAARWLPVIFQSGSQLIELLLLCVKP